MKFRYLDRQEYPRWDEFVDASPQGSIYAKSFYLDALNLSYRIGVVEEPSGVLGGIVLSRNELGFHTNPLFVKYLGVLYGLSPENKAIEQSVRFQIDRTIIGHLPRFGVWSYAFHPEYPNWLAFYWARFRQTTYYTHQIEFVPGADFRDLYREKVRHPLRQAVKNALIVGDISAGEFADVNFKTYRKRRSKPPYSRARLVAFLEAAEQRGCLYKKAARDGEGNVHAVGAVVHDRRSANLILHGTDPAYSRLGGGTLLVDHLIEFASRGSRIFDFEGSMIERIELFYRGFGGRMVPYHKISRANPATVLYETGMRTAKRIFYR